MYINGPPGRPGLIRYWHKIVPVASTWYVYTYIPGRTYEVYEMLCQMPHGWKSAAVPRTNLVCGEHLMFFIRGPARQTLSSADGWQGTEPLQHKYILKYIYISHIGRMICVIYFHFMIQVSQGRQIPDLQHLAHVAGWEPYNLHDLARVSWVGSVPYRSCTASHNGR